MKMTIYDLRFTICRRRAQTPPNRASACPPGGKMGVRHRASRIAHRQSREGVALVVTLILLSVTLVMAIAFLAISRRARNASNTSTDTATARLASDSALAAAQAQIAATVLARPAATYDYGLLASTNFVDANTADTTYNTYFDVAGGLLPDIINAVTNQWVLPRPPVFVATNAGSPLDFRYYLDLNRNGRFEDSGDNVPNVELDLSGNAYTNGFIPETGDPQWIGVLEHPDQPHGPDNRYVARYAFFAQPIGNSLDLNYIHNQVDNTLLNSGQDGYLRNQGVGSWELNLAGFLADLNTNLWDPVTAPYVYNRYSGSPNSGNAFFDAFTLLDWRYNNSYSSLAPISTLFNNGALGLQNSPMDVFSLGPLLNGTYTPNYVNNPSPNNWAGADNTNRFFNLMTDLSDPNKNSVYFTNRLLSAGNGVSTYDRYTFYRLLDQLGTDSTVDDDRINLNYSNAVVEYNGGVVTSVTVIPGAETNTVPWRPLDFFSAAADRMLRYYTARWFAENPTNYLLTYYNITNFPNYIGKNGYGLTNVPYFGMTNEVPSFGLTNIPVYVNGRFYYSPAVNRLLQLAANLYDASTNQAGVLGRDYPHVFRPMFTRLANNDVWIDGFREINNQAGGLVTGTAPLDAPILRIEDNTWNMNAGPTEAKGNIYGIPWIIGAKKGFPNFNQFYVRNIAQVTRKLEVWRTDATKPGALGTNQMFIMSITNQMGCSFWNSYDTNYAGNLTVYLQDVGYMLLTNGANTWPMNFSTNYTFNLSTWLGSHWTANSRLDQTARKPQSTSFLPFSWKFEFLPESVYNASTATFTPVVLNPNPLWDVASPVPLFPQFGLMTTNWLQAYILDNGHVIDYVQLRGPNSARNLNEEIADSYDSPDAKVRESMLHDTAMWDTNGVGTGTLPPPTKGVVNQINVSRKGPNAFTIKSAWKKPPNMPNLSLGTTTLEEAEAAFFDGFFQYQNAYQVNGNSYYNTNLVVQAPYTPTRTVWDYTSWQVNDPLVHYLASDLNTVTKDTGLHRSDDLVNDPMPVIALNTLNERYQPWGRNAQMSQVPDRVQVNGNFIKVDYDGYNLRLRDPLVWGSDYWDFPAYKLPTVGWLGRVHRGTPWQTIYLKASDILQETDNGIFNKPDLGTNTWAQWTGDTQLANVNGNSHYYDAANSGPAQDGGLFDLFTTRLNDNAVRGALSVNQSHLAAWSAVLSGVVTLTNTTKSPTPFASPTYTSMIIQPAGLAGGSSPVGQIVSSIYSTRTNYVNVDGVKGVFEQVGDVLRTPALSDQSPFLNLNPAIYGAGYSQLRDGIGDEVYEWLPQQIMGLLRVGSTPRYVVYCYGQTLRPAPNGTVLTGDSFNLVTNYQVTAESAARAVIRVDRHATATGTNYTTTVESYNVLPPD